MSNLSDFFGSSGGGGGGGVLQEIILGKSQTWTPPKNGTVSIIVIGGGGAGGRCRGVGFAGGGGGREHGSLPGASDPRSAHGGGATRSGSGRHDHRGFDSGSDHDVGGLSLRLLGEQEIQDPAPSLRDGGRDRGGG